MKVKKCRICKSFDLSLVFSLGKQPLVNNLLSHPKEKQKVFPLELLQCNHCGLIQLNFVVSKEKMFDNYFYIPSASHTYLKHFDKLSTQLIKELKLEKDELVVDIGGSDGSFLRTFEKKGMKVVNIEPAKNITSSVTKVNKYFNKKTAQYVVKKYGQAKLATATNVFAHIDDIHEFISNLDIILDKDGVFFAQFPDVRNLLNENQFDTIYHEHLSYFGPEPLYHLFNNNSPFEIFKIEDSEIHGGSMRLYLRKRRELLNAFSINAKQIKKELRSFLTAEKKKGKKIAGFGAAAKGLTLLYYCELDNQVIDYIADGNPYKQGKFSAGTKIPIFPESEIIANPPDIVLVLAWNFKDEIIAKVQRMLPKNKPIFVIPIPQVTIVE